MTQHTQQIQQTQQSYEEFIQSKQFQAVHSGFEVDAGSLNPHLFDWQRELVRWSIGCGRSALFLDTGLGKTLQQLAWADEVAKHTGERVLLLSPLGVRHQTLSEARKFNIETPVKICSDGLDVEDGITITNYDRLHKFDTRDFAGVVLDESSLLKSFTSSTRDELTERFRQTPYKLPCTATPAPNDAMELGNHAEFCGAMGRNEMLSMFFTHDGGSTSKWRLRGHADSKFWEWMASWAVMIRKPSDIGYSDEGYDLPPLNIIEHVVDTPIVKGHLFQAPAATLAEQRAARRETISPRIARMLELFDPTQPAIVWCNLNDESTTATKILREEFGGDDKPEIVEVTGSLPPEMKELRLQKFVDGTASTIVSKSEICGFGMNFQHCQQMFFLGLSHSYEQFYQAVRRCWRFGQRWPVTVHVIVSDRDDSILANIKRKQAEADKMARGMVEAMAGFTRKAIGRNQRMQDKYNPTKEMEVPQWLCRN